jgi:hypothetical protein
MTRTTIMLSTDVKRRATAEARRRKVSFADFVRQAICDKLPQLARSADRQKRRRQDPLFRLLDHSPPAQATAATDVAVNHDEYLYGRKADGKRR